MSSFGIVLGRLRATRGMRAKQLAEMIGLHPSYVTHVERGYRVPPRKDVLERLGKALNLSEGETLSLIRMASNTRALHALANIEEPTMAIRLAEVLIGESQGLGEKDFYELRQLITAYIANRSDKNHENAVQCS